MTTPVPSNSAILNSVRLRNLRSASRIRGSSADTNHNGWTNDIVAFIFCMNRGMLACLFRPELFGAFQAGYLRSSHVKAAPDCHCFLLTLRTETASRFDGFSDQINGKSMIIYHRAFFFTQIFSIIIC